MINEADVNIRYGVSCDGIFLRAGWVVSNGQELGVSVQWVWPTQWNSILSALSNS